MFTHGYKTHREDNSVQVDIVRVENIEVLVNSEPTCNIIDCGLWEKLKLARIKCKTGKPQKLFAFNFEKQLDVILEFSTCVSNSSDPLHKLLQS